MVKIKAPGSWKFQVKVKNKLTPDIRTDIVLYFHNLLLYHLLKLNYTAFVSKALGKADSFGETWKPLADKTRKWKRRKRILYNGKVAINVRTRKLLHALKPNRFVNGRYVPGPNQRVSISTKLIQFEPIVEYADEVDAIRNIFIKDMKTWIDKAVDKSIPSLQKYINARGY